MGRKKKYDRDTLVEKSMELFRDHGFAGTSTQMLVEGLGVNRFSLYAEFGNKQKLFDDAEMIVKVKEPQAVERAMLREGAGDGELVGGDDVNARFERVAVQRRGVGRGDVHQHGVGEALADLLDRLQTIGNKGRADDQELLRTSLGQSLQLKIGVRFQPGIAA